MANYYDSVSFLLPRVWPKEAHKWVVDEIDKKSGTEESLGVIAALENGLAWISTDDSASVDGLVLLLQGAMQQFKIKGRFGFAWAGGCDKPRVDSCISGAVYFNRNKVWSMDTFTWLRQHGVGLELQ